MKRRPTAKVPVILTEGAYARASIAAEMEGVGISEYIEACLRECVPRTVHAHREHQFAEACREAIRTSGDTPHRWEWGLPEQPKSFVRRPAGSGENQGGRPSSRQHQAGRRAEAWSTAPKAGPEPRAAAGAQRRGEHGEDPPVDLAEHSGTTRLNYTPRPQN
jgi:hypothetical protein